MSTSTSNSTALIPPALLGEEQKLTAVQISHYRIYAGPGGTWVREWYKSDLPEYSEYRFHLRSVTADENGYYYLTIYRAENVSDPELP